MLSWYGVGQVHLFVASDLTHTHTFYLCYCLVMYMYVCYGIIEGVGSQEFHYYMLCYTYKYT